MNEAETRAELIDPALQTAGWGVVDGSRVGREVITLGRLQGAGKRLKQDIADYVLSYRGHKLAVIEAKRRDLADTEGVAQAKRYSEDDFNKLIEIKEREAYRVKLFMQAIDQRQKTLVFCATQVHALAVRDLINQMKTNNDPNYCVRVTANDGAEGERWLRTFQDNEKTIPTILTTSQKLSTGVDARNIRNIVLMRPINSMIEFKQIIGRGTRLFDDKDYFTIYDFVKGYHHFSDPEWDGEPLEPETAPPTEVREPGNIYQPQPDPPAAGGDHQQRPEKIKITLANGKELKIQHMMATIFWHPNGSPMSAAEFTQQLFGEFLKLFRDEDELRALWGQPDTRKALLDGLAEKGFGQEQLVEAKLIISADRSDIFDVLAYIAFSLPPMSRETRVATHQHKIYASFDDKLHAFLDFVLQEYVNEGVNELDQGKLPNLLELKYGTVSDAVTSLGSIPEIKEVFVGFQQYLYTDSTTETYTQ